MGDQTQRPACPKCREPMELRLSDFECSGCGFFINASRIRQTVELEPSSVQRRIADAQLQQLEGAGGRSKPQLYALDRQPPGFFARWVKAIFLVFAFCEMVGMNIYVRIANPDLDLDRVFVRIVVVAGVFLIGLASVPLFVNWPAFKKFSIVCAGLMVAYYIYNAVMIWQDASQELVYQLVLDVVLLLWFIFILASDIIRDR